MIMRRQVIDPAAIEAAIEQLGSYARDALGATGG
jgi:hypothetical protein